MATISSNGLITAKSLGNTVITAITVNGKKATCNVSVIEKTPQKVVLSTSSVSMDKGEGYQITGRIEPADANQYITWSSNNTGVVTVNSSGYITGVNNGKATITAKASNGISKSCEIIVYQPINSYSALVLFTKNDPYGYARIAKDITVNLLSYATEETPFRGVINGDNHTITINNENTINNVSTNSYTALISSTNGAVIKNLTINGKNIQTYNYTGSYSNYCGGIVAKARNTTFENCINNAEIKAVSYSYNNSGYGYSGGIVGWSENCMYINCKNTGNIQAITFSDKVSYSISGGVSGGSSGGEYNSCSSSGHIFTHASTDSTSYYALAYSGGIVGEGTGVTVNKCSSSGNIIANSWPPEKTYYSSIAATGGIIGAGNGNITNCTSNCSFMPSAIYNGENYQGEMIAYKK